MTSSRKDALAPHADMDDTQLVQSILAGESGSFDLLHSRYHDRIYRFAVRRLRDPIEAQDVTQDVFLQIHRCLHSFEGRSTLLTWMFGIAHNQVCRRFRRKTPMILPIEELEVASGATKQVPIDRQVDAARLLEGCSDVLESVITPDQRRVFKLRYAENHSTRSIAEVVGKSNQAVKISLFRTRRALSQRLPEIRAVLAATA